MLRPARRFPLAALRIAVVAPGAFAEGAIAVPLIVGRALQLPPEDVAFLISADLFVCGIASIIQSLGAGAWLGVRLPVMMGVTFAAVGPMVAIAGAAPGAEGARALFGAVIGAGLGFLWFNAPPAAIFMGDTGSLALGGALGAIAVTTKHELVLGIVGGLFVVEAASVMIQVGYFKLTGKRIFLMAPVHHHFEKMGWPESTVVIRFWIIAGALALVGLSTLKLR